LTKRKKKGGHKMRDFDTKTRELNDCIGMIHSIAERYLKNKKQKNKIALSCIRLHEKLREKRVCTNIAVLEINRLANSVLKGIKETN
jgi:hypothetical protein